MKVSSELVGNPTVAVIGSTNPFRPQCTTRGKVFAGTSIGDAITLACRGTGARKRWQRYGVAQVGRKNGKYWSWRTVMPHEWNRYRLSEGDVLRFRLFPLGGGGGGGKSPLRTILTVIITIAAVAAAAWTGGSSLTILGLSGKALGGVVGALIMSVGQVLINAIAPLQTPNVGLGGVSGGGIEQSQVYSISAGSNSVNRWGRVPVPLGKGRFAPPKAALPYTELEGNDIYLHELFCWGECGEGSLDITDIKIGDTPISNYDEVRVETWRYDPNNPYFSPIYSNGRNMDEYSILVANSEGWVTRTVKGAPQSITLNFAANSFAYFDDKGNTCATRVDFEIRYRAVGSSSWMDGTAPTASTSFDANAYAVGDWQLMRNDSTGALTLQTSATPPAGCSRIAVAHSYRYAKYYRRTYHYYESSPEGGTDGSGYWGDWQEIEEKYYRWGSGGGWGNREYKVVYHASWSITNTGYYDYNYSVNGNMLYLSQRPFYIEAASTTQVRRGYTIFPRVASDAEGVEVSVRRTTGDRSSNNRYQDQVYLTSLVSKFNERPIRPSYPVMLTAISVKASGQINGSLDTVTGAYQLNAKYYDGSTWRLGPTRSIASAFRYVLQQPCNARPQSDSSIDLDGLAQAAKYWDSKGWEFNYVLDSDSSVFNRVQEICSAGRASPTMVDGKWSVVIDKPRDTVVLGINAANSWGWNVTRTTAGLPHYILAEFINEETWERDEREVRTDEPLPTNGTPPTYEKISYTGITNPDVIYQMSRFHYADAKQKVRSIVCTMWDESIMATRGDLVECCQPYLMTQGLASGRITGVIQNASGSITAVKVDVQCDLLDSRDLGIKVYLASGKTYVARLARTTATTQTLTLNSATNAAIDRGDKFVLGDYGELTFLAVILGMKYNADFTCELTMCDYTPIVYNADTEEIPPFTSIITTPIGTQNKLYGVPNVIQMVSDERVLVRVEKSLLTRVMFDLDRPFNIDPRATHVEIHRRPSGTTDWLSDGTFPVEQLRIFLSGFDDEALYDFRLRYIGGRTGQVGDWKLIENYRIVGKTTIPPDVENFTATIKSPIGIELAWDNIDLLDIDHYRISGDARTDAIGTPAMVQVRNKVGTVSFNIIAVDTGGRVSATPATATVTVESPKAVFYDSSFDDVVTKSDGAYIVWKSCETTWPIRDYAIKDNYTGNTINCLTETLRVEPRPSGSYTFTGVARDIFDNKGDTGTYLIQINPPAAPAPVASIHNMSLRISWSAVDTDFPIDRYEVYDGYGALKYSLKATFFDLNDPKDGTTYNIYAVDTAGNRSTAGVFEVDIEPPSAPTVKAEVNEIRKDGVIIRDGINVSWNAPASTLPIIGYEVWRQYEDEAGNIQEQDYGSVDATYIIIPACKAGVSTFYVRPINSAGTKGATGYIDFDVFAPGAPTMKNPSVIDNNVLLYWNVPEFIFFTVNAYEVYSDDKFVGIINGLFATVFEAKAGLYTYKVIPVDIAGNKGTPATILANVNQPPDYVFLAEYDNYEYRFKGTKTNLQVLDDTYLYGPMSNWPETWEANYNRCATAGMASEGATVTWENKIDNNAPMFFSPQSGTATYVDLIDYGTVISSMNISVSIYKEQIEGTSVIGCKIEGSPDNSTWAVYNENGTGALVNNTRYLRITLTITGGLVKISNVIVRLDSKKLNDNGSVYTDKDDNGPNVATDNMDIGTFVEFNKGFTDVIQPITVESADGATNLHPLVVFEDVPKPTGFRVSLWNNEGVRVSGYVKWSCSGY